MTHYDEFGLRPTASLEEIRRAHRNLAKLLHPDPIQDGEVRRVAENQLKRLNGIYSVLVDPARRQQYDLQVSGALAVNWRPAALERLNRWRIPAVAAGLSLVAGFLAANWWASPQLVPAAERIVYVERPERPAEPARPELADTRELRRMLNQVISERDQALARLTVVRARPAALDSMAIPAMAAKPAPAPAAAEPPPVASVKIEAALPVEPEKQPPVRPRALAGTWMLSAQPGSNSPPGRYAAEYIELQITEKDNLLWGRYRARYKVPDRAISPEVQFFFEGASTGDTRYTWRGDAGSAGEIQLRLLSDATLSLNWFTNQFGQGLKLASGSAVLVRRRQE